MILITGANGHLGTLTIDYLLKKNVPANTIAALVRDVKKGSDLLDKGISLRTGDYTDEAALLKALEGIDTLLLISSGTLENRTQQHINVINAAKQNGVKHIVYTSMLKASPDSKFTPAADHYETEAYLKTAGVPFTVLRNTFYAELIPMLLGDALQTGTWYYAAGDAKANFASRVDMAEALANVIIHPDKQENKIYEIASGNVYSFSEIAGIVSETSGTQVNYNAIPVDALKEGMRKAGVPELHIPLMASVAETIEAGELDVIDASLEHLLERKPVDLKEYLPVLLSNAN